MLKVTLLDINPRECWPTEGIQQCLRLIDDKDVRVLDVGDDEDTVMCFMSPIGDKEQEQVLANIVYAEYRNMEIGSESILDRFYDSADDTFHIPNHTAMALIKEVK